VNSTYLPATRAVGDLHTAVAQYHGDQLAYLAAEDPTFQSQAASRTAKDQSEAGGALDTLAALTLSQDEHARYMTVKVDWQAYLAVTADLATADKSFELVAFVDGGRAQPTRHSTPTSTASKAPWPQEPAVPFQTPIPWSDSCQSSWSVAARSRLRSARSSSCCCPGASSTACRTFIEL